MYEVTSTCPFFLFLFFNNHCVMTEGKLREGGKGSMSSDLFL